MTKTGDKLRFVPLSVTSSCLIPICEALRYHLQDARANSVAKGCTRAVAIIDDVIAGFERRFGDGSQIATYTEGPNRQPCGYKRHQVVATLLDPRYMLFDLALSGIPEEEHANAKAILKEELIVVINDHRPKNVAEEPEEGSGWIGAVTAEMQQSGAFNAEELADNELRLWWLREEPLPLDQNPLKEWKMAAKILPYMAILARKFLCVPATSAPAERLFSSAGNTNSSTFMRTGPWLGSGT